MLFKDRKHAAILLSEALAPFRDASPFVIGLARGGVEVAAVIAAHLHATFDVLVVKKISSPHNPELAIGAVAQDNISCTNWKEAFREGADQSYIQEQVNRLTQDIRRQSTIYRKGKHPILVEGRLVMLVDDGVATGATMEAAIRWASMKKAKKIIVATPIISEYAAKRIFPKADALIVLKKIASFGSVSQWYVIFEQVSDKEVIELLH